MLRGMDHLHGIGIPEDIERFHECLEVGDGEGYYDGFVAVCDDETLSRAAQLGEAGLGFFHVVRIWHGKCIDDAAVEIKPLVGLGAELLGICFGCGVLEGVVEEIGDEI